MTNIDMYKILNAPIQYNSFTNCRKDVLIDVTVEQIANLCSPFSTQMLEGTIQVDDRNKKIYKKDIHNILARPHGGPQILYSNGEIVSGNTRFAAMLECFNDGTLEGWFEFQVLLRDVPKTKEQEDIENVNANAYVNGKNIKKIIVGSTHIPISKLGYGQVYKIVREFAPDIALGKKYDLAIFLYAYLSVEDNISKLNECWGSDIYAARLNKYGKKKGFEKLPIILDLSNPKLFNKVRMAFADGLQMYNLLKTDSTTKAGLGSFDGIRYCLLGLSARNMLRPESSIETGFLTWKKLREYVGNPDNKEYLKELFADYNSRNVEIEKKLVDLFINQ